MNSDKEKTIIEIRNKIKDIVNLYAKYFNKKIDDNQSISAERIEKMLTNELFIGLDENKEPKAEFFYEKINTNNIIKTSDNISPIIVENISIFSICEHHFLPFIGKATFKYVPMVEDVDEYLLDSDTIVATSLSKHIDGIRHNGTRKGSYIKTIGLSKIPRIIDYLARKPQTQERLTIEIFEKFKKILETDNISISMTCEHLCAKMRGIKDPVIMTTSKSDGCFIKQQ